MSDIKLFSLNGSTTSQGQVIELKASYAKLEKDLQQQIESDMESFLGVRFLATEYSTGKNHKGRIDSLGIDENGCPVIIEYKRHSNENVINQGLFYLDWLMDHQAEFQLLVIKELGAKFAEEIEWTGSRLICIASDYTRYDEHAVKQIDRNIELVRYRYFGEDLLLLELVNAQQSSLSTNPAGTPKKVLVNPNQEGKVKSDPDSQAYRLSQASENLVKLYDQLCDFVVGLGEDVQRKEIKTCTNFKAFRNFCSVVVLSGKKDAKIQIYLKLAPIDNLLEEGFTRDVTNIGHWGNGNLEVTIRDEQSLERSMSLIEKSYRES